MKGKQIPALAVLCCALSLTAPVWAVPAVEGLSQSAVTATTAVPAAQLPDDARQGGEAA